MLAELDVVIGYVPLPSGLSWWEPNERVVLIDPSLDQVSRRCALAHELEHIAANDSGCRHTRDDAWFESRMERLAWVRAARKLVPVEALAQALVLHEGDDVAVCETLDVTQLVLDVRRETLQPNERHELRSLMDRIEMCA